MTTLELEQNYITSDLAIMQKAGHYRAWILEKASPWLGGHILEVGAGIGTFTEYLSKVAEIHAVDVDPLCCNLLKKRLQDIDVRLADASSMRAMKQFLGLGIDTIICLNVLEHISDDMTTLEIFHKILTPGGRLVLLVPALPRLYGPTDQKLGHKRRYTLVEVRERLNISGFKVEESHYLNAPAVFGWYLNKIFKKTKQSPLQVKIYDFLIPVIKEIESLIRPKWGLSVFAVGRK